MKTLDKNRTNFNKELSLFELNIERIYNVSKVHDSLKTIVPTSVEVERTFTAAGLFTLIYNHRLPFINQYQL